MKQIIVSHFYEVWRFNHNSKQGLTSSNFIIGRRLLLSNGGVTHRSPHFYAFGIDGALGPNSRPSAAVVRAGAEAFDPVEMRMDSAQQLTYPRPDHQLIKRVKRPTNVTKLANIYIYYSRLVSACFPQQWWKIDAKFYTTYLGRRSIVYNLEAFTKTLSSE